MNQELSIARSQNHVWFMASFEEMQVLIQGIGCTPIPVTIFSGYSRGEYI